MVDAAALAAAAAAAAAVAVVDADAGPVASFGDNGDGRCCAGLGGGRG